MKRLLAVAATVLLGVTLAGCGSSPSRPHLDPDVAGKPSWGDCQEIAGHFMDYVSGVKGKPTVERALSPYRQPGDHVVVEPRHDHRARRWLLVDDTNLIHTALGISHSATGWLVDSVDECGD